MTADPTTEIRRLHFEDGVAKKELARRFGRDVKTIRRILARDDDAPVRAPRRRLLDPHRDVILRWMHDEPAVSARAIGERLEAQLGKVSERTVRKFVSELREEIEAVEDPEPDEVPDETPDAPEETKADTEAGRGTAAPTAESSPAPRTPADPTPIPVPGRTGKHDLSKPEYFLNRELTWLNFNFRVLHEAQDDSVPLLERVKFVAIVSSNLDEFFMKRIGGLKQQVGAGVHGRTVDGRTPQQQIAECCDMVQLLQKQQRGVYRELLAKLRRKGVEILRWDALTPEEQTELRTYYIDNIFPLATPQATDPAHPFPFVSNLSLNLLVTLHYPGDPEPSLARVKVPVGAGVPRFLRIRGGAGFVPLEAVMARNLDLLFPGMEVDSCSMFRVTRNANTEMEEESAEDLLELIETELRERRFAPIVRLEVGEHMQPIKRGMLAAELGLDENIDVFQVDGMFALRDLMELVSSEQLAELLGPAARDPAHHPLDHPDLTTNRNIFHTIRDVGSILVHHPYQSYPTSVERFLREASRDPKVRAIKMTLYRTSAGSKTIDHLIDAAKNGKQVAVVVELKARFDEAANIRWAQYMEEVGVHVTYGVLGLKTHCKVILVVRQDYNGLRRYAHIGTGNYHAVTARLYSDVGMITSDENIGRDLTELFNYLTTGYKPKRAYRKILPAPKLCKQGLLERIEREVGHAERGEEALLRFKTNALEDPTVTRALYRASQAGVRIELLIRDTCRLRPGIPGLSENVRVVSIVGRFLEHTRVYYFHNGGEEEYYIGSADCMKRNLDSRVEILAPVEAPELRKDLRIFLDLQLADRRLAWEMQPDGSYVQLQAETTKQKRGSQHRLMEWADARLREATRLRRRRPQGVDRRNVR